MLSTPGGKRLHPLRIRKKRRERLLTASQWDELFLTFPSPLLLVDRSTLAILGANRAAVALYGYLSDELRCLNLRNLHHDDELSRLERAAAAGFGGEEAGRRWRQHDCSGSTLNVSLRAHPVTFANRGCWLIVVQDESGSIRSEDALLIMQALMDQAQAAAELGLWIVGLDDQYLVTWMDNVYRIFGVDPSEFEPEPEAVMALIHPDDRERVRAAFERAIAERSSVCLDHRIVRPSGEVRWVHQRARIVVTRDDTPVRLIGLALDITERRQREDDLIEQQRLAQALAREIAMRQLQERFVSILSHEFKTPLASIALAIDLLKRYGYSMTAEDRCERLERIQGLVNDLSHLIEDVLVLVRAESHEHVRPMERISIQQLTAEILKIIRQIEQRDPAAYQGRVVLTNEVTSAAVRGDIRLLSHALNNLIGNALKYSPDDRPVQIALHDADDRLMIAVRDHGIGIAESDLPHVFEPFYRGSNTGERPGTGLGLTIALRVLQLHAGTIDVHSKIGQGTTFTVTLPLEP